MIADSVPNTKIKMIVATSNFFGKNTISKVLTTKRRLINFKGRFKLLAYKITVRNNVKKVE